MTDISPEGVVVPVGLQRCLLSYLSPTMSFSAQIIGCVIGVWLHLFFRVVELLESEIMFVDLERSGSLLRRYGPFLIS